MLALALFGALELILSMTGHRRINPSRPWLTSDELRWDRQGRLGAYVTSRCDHCDTIDWTSASASHARCRRCSSSQPVEAFEAFEAFEVVNVVEAAIPAIPASPSPPLRRLRRLILNCMHPHPQQLTSAARAFPILGHPKGLPLYSPSFLGNPHQVKSNIRP